MLDHWPQRAMNWQKIRWMKTETSGHIYILKSCAQVCNHFPPYLFVTKPPHGIWELIDCRAYKCRQLRQKRAVRNGARHIDSEAKSTAWGWKGWPLNHFLNFNHNFFTRNAMSAQWLCQHIDRHTCSDINFFKNLTTTHFTCLLSSNFLSWRSMGNTGRCRVPFFLLF